MKAFKTFFVGFMQGFRNFSNTVTDIINFILLLIVYIIGIGMVSIISKLFNKHFLDLKNKGSSWVIRKLKKNPMEDYYRTF